MAQCKLNPQDFIKNTFTPQIAVMCTSGVKKCCEKNNLEFSEMLHPFSKLSSEVSFKDVSGSARSVKNLKLTFLDINWRPPQTTLARKLLNSAVSDTYEQQTKICNIKNYQLEIPVSTPWFENWKDTFLQVQYPSDHEFTKHFLACFLIVSSSDPNPSESMKELLQSLTQIQATTVPEKLPKWFDSSILKYYVILHDNVDGSVDQANSTFESFKSSYGAPNCFCLKINSRAPGLNDELLPDPWSQFLTHRHESKKLSCETSPEPSRRSSVDELKTGMYHPLSPEVEDVAVEAEVTALKSEAVKSSHGTCLSVDDIEQIKGMIFEFTRMCLLPYVERQIVMLNDAVTNKKGVSKSLLSATKRWFSTNKPNVLAVNNLVYSSDSPELQVRKLGDLYFMFGNYSGAFQAYHTAKRDYHADQAWLYYAGALEMAALSAFMSNESSRKTYDYMEESITTYLNVCKLPQFATRATILSSECLQFNKLFGETAHQLIRMTCEDSDLRSALLLEQASYCFMNSNMLRKYAFHMVLAGHRFFKANQKHHSLRCYVQAYQIYEDSNWDLARDHIHYTRGRLATSLQRFDEAVTSFAKLLTGESKQSGQQQATFLKEYLTILESKVKEDKSPEVPTLPVPDLNESSVKILVGPVRPLSTPGKVPAIGMNFDSCEDSAAESKWHKLEEMLLLEDQASAPLIFKPAITLYNAATISSNVVQAIINEPIQVSFEFSNNLQTALVLNNLYLLWTYDSTVSNLEVSDAVDKYIKTYIIKSVVIQSNSKQDVIFSLTPLKTGDVTITAVCYNLSATSSGGETICVKGKKPFDLPIKVKVVPYAPCLQMVFSELNLEFLAGEVQRVSVELQNSGSVPLRNVMLATSVPHLVSNCEMRTEQRQYTTNDGDNVQVKEKLARKNHVTSIPLPTGQLDSGEKISFHIWVRAPHSKGSFAIDLLTYYENIDTKSVPRYRLIRHTWNLSVQESISVDITIHNSYNSRDSEDLAFALKTTNLNQIHNSVSTEITLLNIAVLSETWVLSQDIVTPKYINLGSLESAHILLKAKRGRPDAQYSSIPLNSDKVAVPHLATAYQSFAAKSHIPLLNAFVQNYVGCRRDATLVLEWRALVYDVSDRRIVYGHSCVPVSIVREYQQVGKVMSDTMIDINSPVDVEEKIIFDQSQSQVMYNMLHPSMVEHNFCKKKTCVVPVKLVLHNIVNETITVTINTTNISTKPTHRVIRPFKIIYSTKASGNLCWLTNGKIVRVLDPMNSVTVNLCVVVVGPGTFDLGANLEVFCSTSADQEPVLQAFDILSSLIVVDCY